jgi:hypothetical protein
VCAIVSAFQISIHLAPPDLAEDIANIVEDAFEHHPGWTSTAVTHRRHAGHAEAVQIRGPPSGLDIKDKYGAGLAFMGSDEASCAGHLRMRAVILV